MNKQAYRKFKVMTVLGVDDFASMREVVKRRYRRLLDERDKNAEKGKKAAAQPMPSLVLVDGGLGQLHAAAEALESLDFAAAGLTPPPLASIANVKRSSTSTATKKSRSFSTAARQCCISSSSSAMRATASPSAIIASAEPCATATQSC